MVTIHITEPFHEKTCDVLYCQMLDLKKIHQQKHLKWFFKHILTIVFL
jgi:hypothetical protein